MLGLRDRGAVRVGFTHYNTLDEVDALLAALAGIAC
jgi:selenocysteine lyase/cysteine desulfurase